MQGNDKNIREILNYLGNKMPEQERYAFERKMQADPFLTDAVEGYERMSLAEIEEELSGLKDTLSKRTNRKIIPVWVRAAAGILLLVGLGTLWMIYERPQKTGLVSDRIEIKEETKKEEDKFKEEPQVLPEHSEEKSYPTLPERKEENTELVVKTRNVAPVPVSKKIMKKAKVSDVDELKQDVNMHLRYEDSAVGVEQELVGKIAGVDVGEIEGSGGGETKAIKIRGMASYKMDTSSTYFRGRVVDEAGMPLPGVAVVNSPMEGAVSSKYRHEGAITDNEGNFKIKSSGSGAVLQLSFIGFKDKLAVAKTDSVGTLVMEAQQMALDEVVAVGYGTQKKSEVTGAVRAQKSSSEPRLASSSATPETALVPEPEMGLKKFIRKVERGLNYPLEVNEERIVVEVEIFISGNGEVDKIDIQTPVNKEFADKLKEKIRSLGKWTTPEINGIPVASSRELTFEFDRK